MWICLKDPAFVDQLIAATGIGIWTASAMARGQARVHRHQYWAR